MTTKSHSGTELRFDPEKHQYWIGKRRIPGVSEILQKVGLSKNYEGIDPFYRDRGIATHKAIELHLKGILDPKSLDPVVVPHFEAFLSYQKKLALGEIRALEVPMTDLPKVFAGTPDLITDRAIFDWKCSKAHDRAAELQGQAYQVLSIAQGFGAKPFTVVELHDDGTFEEFVYGDGIALWGSVIELWKWRTK